MIMTIVTEWIYNYSLYIYSDKFSVQQHTTTFVPVLATCIIGAKILRHDNKAFK